MRLLRDYVKVIRGVQREAKLFLLTSLVYWLGMTLVQLYLNFYLQALRIDQGWIGLINAAPQITIVVMTLVIGGVSRKLGPWLSILIGTIIAGAAIFVTAMSSDAWAIFVASMVMGLGGGFVWSNAGPFLMQHSPERSRATLFSVQAAMGTLVGFVAYLGGGSLPGLLASLTGAAENGVVVLRIMMALAGAAYLLSIVPFLFARPKAVEPSEEKVSGGAPEEKRRAKLFGSNPRLLFSLLLPGTLVGLGAGMTIPFMNIYIERKFNVDFAQLGQLFAWTAVATAVALLLQPVLADRVGKVKSVVMVQIGSLPFLLVLGYVEFFPLVAVALFVRAALMNMGNPVFSAYAMERVDEGDRATYASLSSSAWSLGWASGSWLSGVLRDALGFFEGFAILFGLMALLYATSTVIMWLMFGREEKRRLQLSRAKPGGEVEDSPALAA